MGAHRRPSAGWSGARPVRRRRSRRRRRRTRRIVLLVLGVGLLAALGWLAYTGLQAQRTLSAVYARVGQMQTMIAGGHVADAEAVGAALPAMTRHAHALTEDPLWRLAARVPVLGRPAIVLQGATAASQELGTHTVPALVTVASRLQPDALRTAGNRIDTRPLQAAVPVLGQAQTDVTSAVTLLQGLPAHTWLAALDTARANLQNTLTSVQSVLQTADRAARILPDMLGANGQRRYFIALQNEAEMRGTGGLPGAFAVAVADHGSIRFTDFESDAALLPAASGQRVPSGQDFGADFDAAYGSSVPTSFFPNSDMDANFPYAARTWAGMWQKVSGQHVDGAIAIDPTVLSYILAETGPVAGPDGTQVTSDNIVSLMLKDEYSRFSDQTARKAFLVGLMKAATQKVTDGSGSAAGLAMAASRAAQQRRLLVWTSDASDEAVLGQTDYSGAVPVTTAPYSGLVLNNIAAGKLDYYLARSLTYQSTGCNGYRDVLVTIGLTNDAPASGLPAYVVAREDQHAYPTRPGDSRMLVDYLATDGATLQGATLDGRPVALSLLRELGHPVFRYDLELPRGTTQTLVLHLQEPASTQPPVVMTQAGVNAMNVQVDAQTCQP